MAFNPSLSELVIFELPDPRRAQGLLALLSPIRLTWMQNGDGVSVVAALLNPDRLDVAVLLRTVQAWLDRTGIAAIRFELDGKTYVLDAARAGVGVR
jgi:hypothetical protein